MGGKAIPNARRMPREDYDRITGKVCHVLLTQFPQLKLERLRSYSYKSDFGNLSLVVAKTSAEQDKAVREALIMLSTSQFHRDFGERIAVDIEGAQVDMTFVAEKDMEFFLAYHAYNGLGGLVGKVAHSMGLTLRETGLVYRIMDGDQLVEEIVLANYWQEALRILGYNSVCWMQGFRSLENIFEFVASSVNFRAHQFYVTEQAEPGVRPTVVQLFSQWLQTVALSSERNAVLEMLFKRVPGFEEKYQDVVARIESEKAHKQAVRERFNGNLVAEWTGRKNHALGKLMQHIEATFGGKDAMHEWVLSVPSDNLVVIKQKVMELHTDLS